MSNLSSEELEAGQPRRISGQLADSEVLLIERVTERYLRRWMWLFGITVLGLLALGAAYVFVLLPQQAAQSALAHAEPEIQGRADELALVTEERIDGLLLRSEKRLDQIESRIDAAVGEAGRFQGATDAIGEAASGLTSSFNEAKAFFEGEDFGRIGKATEFLDAFSSSDADDLQQQFNGLRSELDKIRAETPVVRVLLSETDINTAWPDGGIIQTEYTNYWGPFEIETGGGDLLVMLDSAFSGNTLPNNRAWIRLVVDGIPTRTIMAYSEIQWALSSLVLNDLIRDLPPGSHSLEFEAKVQEGGNLQAPHRNPETGDEASRRLIVLELPAAQSG